MDTEHKNSQMEICIKENTIMEDFMEGESITGLMDHPMMDILLQVTERVAVSGGRLKKGVIATLVSTKRTKNKVGDSMSGPMAVDTTGCSGMTLSNDR